ncbi:hypothetical protein Plhal304r1_c041g0120021 [Plasmopara halstedii]
MSWILWYKARWKITWHDLPPEERAAYGLEQPIWFHADAQLHYKQTKRSSTTVARHRCIGMVPAPQRSFRLHVSRVYRLRSLSDSMVAGSAWPSRQDFVQRHIDFTLESTSPELQAKWLGRLYKETTQIVARLGALRLALPLSRMALECS